MLKVYTLKKLHPVYTRKRIYTLQDIKDRTIMQEITWKYTKIKEFVGKLKEIPDGKESEKAW